MSYVDFISQIHGKTDRDYLKRVTEHPKAELAKVSKKFGKEYWDGDRKYGYGGYYYDGRWEAVAEDMAEHYNIEPGDKILDVGCGKGFLLYDFTQVVPGVEVTGLDISEYAINNSKEEVQDDLEQGNAVDLPYQDDQFDLVISINTLHNLYCHELEKAIKEIERVGKDDKYICVEAYRNEEERVNLFYWQLTCECFYTPEEWEWWYDHCEYTGDYSFIYFE